MRVVQANFCRDRLQRPPEQLLQAWPSVLTVGQAARTSGVDVQVVQAHAQHTVGGDELVHFTPDVAAEIIRLAPDVVHVHGLAFARHARPVLDRLPRTRVVVQNRGGHAAARWRRPWIHWGLARTSGVMFTTREHATLHAGALPRHVPVFEVIDSSTRFAPGDQAEARALTGLYGSPCILWVGRLNANKDPLTALRAVRGAAQALPRLRLFCCFTEEPLLTQVRSAIAGDDVLRERVILVGPVEQRELEHFYRAADLFISCSHTEGSGFALIEALACGLQPVVSNIPSFRKITQNGAVGRLVDPGDTQGFAQAIVGACEQPAARLQIREHFERYLSFERMGADLRHVYEAVSA